MLVVVLATLGGWWWSQRDGAAGSDDAPAALARDPSARVARAALPYASEPGGGVRVPWVFEPGLAPRRIAGVVRAGGAAAAGARVELRTKAGGAPLSFASVTTETDGRFDFGAVPAGPWLVIASLADWAPGSTIVHSHDPDARPAPDALEIELRACEWRIRGVVSNMAGQPIVGAEIRDTFWNAAGGTLIDTTGADGRFEICAAESIFVVSAAGHEARNITYRKISSAEELDVRLFAAAALTGRVVDADGKPVGNAVVSGGERPLPTATAVTGADGSFRLEGLPPGLVILDAEHPEHGESSGTTAVVASGKTTEGVLIELTSRCRRLSGHVRLNGRPVVGAHLLKTYTQADGSFVARCAGDDPIDLEVSGYAVVSPRNIPAGHESMDDLVVEVARGAVVRGRVTEGGVPAKGAQVGTRMSMATVFSARTVSTHSEPDGTYELAGLEPGTIELQATSTMGQRSGSVSLEITRTGEHTVDFEISSGGTITGTVRGAHGQPLPYLQVTADDGVERTFFDTGATARSGPGGEFELKGVATGRHTIRPLEKAGFTPASGSWPTVEITEASTTVTVDVQVAQEGGRAIAGTVRSDTGAAVVGARVSVDRYAEVATDAQGGFRFEGLVRDTASLRVLDASGASVERNDVRVGDEALVIVLPRTGAIAGTIVSSGDDWDVTVMPLGDDRRTRRRWTSDVRGTSFLAAGLASGSYEVRVSGPAGAGKTTVEVRPGETLPVVIEISGSATIRGTARLFPGGTPAAGLDCSAGSAHDRSAEDGTFVLKNAPAGAVVDVDCVAPDFARVGGASVDVPANGTASVDVHVMEIDMESLGPSSASGDLGARLQPVPAATPAEVAFAAVVPGGPAARAGLQDGDVLVSIDGAPATGSVAAAIESYVATRGAGARVALVVRRGEQAVNATVTLGSATRTP